MKPLFAYTALALVLINVAGNIAANSAEGLEAARQARVERLCAVNKLYCD